LVFARSFHKLPQSNLLEAFFQNAGALIYPREGESAMAFWPAGTLTGLTSADRSVIRSIKKLQKIFAT